MNDVEWTSSRIVALRTALRLSQAEFARVLGVSKRSVRLWETGQTKRLVASSRRLLHDVLDAADEGARNRFFHASDSLVAPPEAAAAASD
ncbi:helix-turn-helix domain-containing protein, partial [Nocardia asiatica]|uniref:helix-turn-helix domain-containing protein n=1 Tax=Nocardia asiatica TaxID=209252 RepID=UPI00146138FA